MEEGRADTWPFGHSVHALCLAEEEKRPGGQAEHVELSVSENPPGEQAVHRVTKGAAVKVPEGHVLQVDMGVLKNWPGLHISQYELWTAE